MMDILNPTLLVPLAGVVISLLIVMAFWNTADEAPYMRKRLARVSGQIAKNLSNTEQRREQLKRRTSDSDIPFLDKIIKLTMPNPQKLRSRLARTGHSITLGAYLLINVLSIMVCYIVFINIFGWGQQTSLLLCFAVGLWLPHKVISRMGNKRTQKFLSTFPDAIDTICRGLRSGLPITETMATVGHELPDPIGIEFTRISDGVRVGRSLEESMWEIAPRLDTPEFRFFIIALAIQKETGGNLAETLGNLADLLRKRHQLALKIKAMSSEARASAMIIGSLPFLMFLLLWIVNKEYITLLINDPRGQVLLSIGLGWLSIGVFVMKQMVSFEI